MTPSMIASILLIIAILLIVAEVFLPSRGVLGILGALAIGGYLYFSIRAGYCSTLEIILFVAGLVLLVFEAVIPGFGLPGITGSVLLFFAITQFAENPGLGLTTLATGILAGLGLGFILVKAGFSSKLLTQSVLNADLSSEKGYLARKNTESLVGQEGISLTPLRPSGRIQVGEQRLDAISQGEFIESQVPIEIYEVSDGRVLVRPKQK
ncbi:NfeD family protein [Kallipyga gabonensis]|uniref:NfeD family protein n=1 Tax=Kallipyga gabonensis TaxID=1686287 RepID=UPI0009EB4446|nr:NfeD family protein [Kallipyga gabonensis]